jgi:hypothetical protein
MNFAEFITKYKGLNYDVFAFAYFKALEDLVGEEQANEYIKNAMDEKQLVKDAADVINKLTEKPKPITGYYDGSVYTTPNGYPNSQFSSGGCIPVSSMTTSKNPFNGF